MKLQDMSGPHIGLRLAPKVLKNIGLLCITCINAGAGQGYTEVFIEFVHYNRCFRPHLISRSICRCLSVKTAKIARSSTEKVVEPLFKVLFIAPHMVRHGVEENKLQGPENTMLKDLQFDLLKCSFDDLCDMRPGVVAEEFCLAFIKEVLSVE